MLISTYPSTAAHSLEEDEWARLEHISENNFKFSDVCSEPGSTGPSSLTSTGVNSTRGVVSHSDVDRDASLDAFSTFGGTQKVDESEEDQEEEDLVSVAMGYLPAPPCLDDYDNGEVTGKTGKDVEIQHAPPTPAAIATISAPLAEVEERPVRPATDTAVPSAKLYCTFNEAILHAIESLSKTEPTQPAATTTPSNIESYAGVAHTTNNGQAEDAEMVDNAADRKEEEEESSDDDSVACCSSVEGTDPPGETNREYSEISINEEHAHSKTYQVQTRPGSREVPETGPSSEWLTDRNNEGKKKEGVVGAKVGGKKAESTKAENSNGSGKKCEWPPCGKMIARDMARHMRTHTGEKPYACSKCPATFARSDICNTHEASCGLKIKRGRPPKQQRDDSGDDDQGRVAQRRRL